MNGDRGAKGSVNDRVISMLYRMRFKKYLARKLADEKLDKEKRKEYLEKMQGFDIDYDIGDLDIEDRREMDKILKETLENVSVDISNDQLSGVSEKAASIENKSEITDIDLSTLTSLGKRIQEFDPATEQFDFEKYDYYELLAGSTGLAAISPDDIIDPDNEIKKVDDELVIIEEVTDFISESSELLSEIKFELNDIKRMIDEQYTKEDIRALDEKYEVVKEKIDKLKKQYLVMKEKYEFEDFEVLESMALIEAIDDYKDRARLDELEDLVDACKEEVEQIDGVLIEAKKSVGIAADIDNKEAEIDTRDREFGEKKEETIYYTDLEKKIGEEAQKQREIIIELDAKLAKVETEVVRTTEYVYNTGRMFASFLRITAGILTAPFSNRNLFGIMLGTRLINRGLRDLRTSINPVERTEVRERYESVEREILNAKDSVDSTLKLIENSMEQVDLIKEDFKTKFAPYAPYIPEYRKVYGMIEKLEKDLQLKKEKVESMQDKLDKQYEKNRQKVYRSSN